MKGRSKVKKPTIKDIAREANVSPATVSLVLRNQETSRVSPATRNQVLEIAKRLNLSETTVRKRLRRLVEEEFIQVIAVGNLPKLINKLRQEIVGNIHVKIDVKKTDHVIQELKGINELWYIARVTGATDFDLEFSVQSQDDLRLLLDRINRIEGVRHTETSIRLQLIRNRYDWEYLDFEKGVQ